MPKGKIVPLLADSGLMRHVREVLRLKFVGGVSIREIARRNGVAASTVRATIKCFQAADLSWPLHIRDVVLPFKQRLHVRGSAGPRRFPCDGFWPRESDIAALLFGFFLHSFENVASPS